MSLVYESSWEYLPDILILEIYKFLDDREKVKMSLTCKRWGSLFNAACLWRVRHFDLSGYSLHEERVKANGFVKKHWDHLRYVTISCGSLHTNEIFQRSINDLLYSQLRQSHLSTFKMDFSQLDRNLMSAPSRGRFTNCVVSFFKQQKQLKILDMTSAHFPSSDGIRVLDAVGKKCGSIMEELFIEDFFLSRISVFEDEKFKQVLTHFSNLNYLAINFNCLSDSLLEILATNLAGLLKTMKIKVCKNDPHIHGISGQTWKKMVTCCPSLSIKFWFDSVGHWSEVISVLQREIPVTDVHLLGGFEDDTDGWGLTRTINHIAECYRNSLESVHLEFNNKDEDFDDAMLGLIGRCKKLRDVNINGPISVATIRSIIQLEEDNKLHLNTLNLFVWDVPYDERVEIMEIQDKYTYLLTKRGLKLGMMSIFAD